MLSEGEDVSVVLASSRKPEANTIELGGFFPKLFSKRTMLKAC
jgi:hypothetical protein